MPSARTTSQLIASGAALGFALRPETRNVALAVLAIGFTFRIVRQRRSAICAALSMTLPGVVAAVVSGSWAREALRGLGANGFESGVGVVLAAIACAAPSHLAIGLALHATRPLAVSTRYVAVAGIVFGVETILSRVPGCVPWSLWGHAAADSGLAQLASPGGVPLVSATLAWAACALAEILDAYPARRVPRTAVAILCGVVATSAWGLAAARVLEGPQPVSSESLHVVAIQPGLPRAERRRPDLQTLNEARLTRYSRSLLGGRLARDTLMVWPEGALLSDPREDHSAKQALARGARLAGELETAMIVGLARRPSPATERPGWNLAAAYDRRGRLVDFFGKRAGVPVVESQPRSRAGRLVASWLGAAGRGAKILESDRLAPLRGAEGAVVLLCYEILLPWVVEGRRPREATLLLGLADDSWAGTLVASRQLTTLARFRAIEQRLPILRITQGGRSASFDAFGEPLGSIEPDRYGALEIDVAATTRPGLPIRLRLLLLPIGATLLAWSLFPIPRRLVSIVGTFGSRLSSDRVRGCSVRSQAARVWRRRRRRPCRSDCRETPRYPQSARR